MADKERPLLLRWTRFASDPHGTGPEKRSFQIRQLARNAGFEISDLKPPETTPRLQTRAAGIAARIRHGSHASVDHAGIGLLGYRSISYSRALAAHDGAKILLWETTYDDLLPAMAKKAGYYVVGLPHNIESFVSDRAFANPSHERSDDFPAEVRRLGGADRLFAISKEEKWLLEANGLACGYLPFYPSGSLKSECDIIRSRRISSCAATGYLPGPLLLLGSAINPATARGMKKQLTWLREHFPQASITVIGPKTDAVFSEFRSVSTHILGGVPRDDLIESLTKCSALLIHTENGAGAVTRIPEALAAGVPIIANSNAARDCHNVPGIHVYETEQEFVALAGERHSMPAMPPEPSAAYRHFQETLTSLYKKAR